MEVHVTKDKLPKGLSYPLKTGALVTALEHANITLDCSLSYQARPGVLTAHFWPPNPNVPYERLYLTVGAVTSLTAEGEREHMMDRALPALVSWIKSILAEPVHSPVRREAQLFSAPSAGAS